LHFDNFPYANGQKPESETKTAVDSLVSVKISQSARSPKTPTKTSREPVKNK